METKPCNSLQTEQFNELKKIAISIWDTYDDTYGYSTEKVRRVEEIENFRDEWTVIVGMFDHINQSKLIAQASPELRDRIMMLLE
jgi:hypothetical protein